MSLLSKLDDEKLAADIQQVIDFALNEKKRNFVETIEIQLGLKNFDAARDRRVAGVAELPHIPREAFSVCVLGSDKDCDEAKAAGVPCLSEEDLKKFNRNKKLVKRLAGQYDAFVASQSMIKKVPRLLGPGLTKAGKFPTVCGTSESVVDVVNKVKATIKFTLKLKPGMPMSVACRVANVGMTKEQITENIKFAINAFVGSFKKKWQNVKRIHIKSTMGPAVRVYGL